jgi:hypothetical protein
MIRSYLRHSPLTNIFCRHSVRPSSHPSCTTLVGPIRISPSKLPLPWLSLSCGTMDFWNYSQMQRTVPWVLPKKSTSSGTLINSLKNTGMFSLNGINFLEGMWSRISHRDDVVQTLGFFLDHVDDSPKEDLSEFDDRKPARYITYLSSREIGRRRQRRLGGTCKLYDTTTLKYNMSYRNNTIHPMTRILQRLDSRSWSNDSQPAAWHEWGPNEGYVVVYIGR